MRWRSVLESVEIARGGVDRGVAWTRRFKAALTFVFKTIFDEGTRERLRTAADIAFRDPLAGRGGEAACIEALKRALD